jgi:hypothetical protein
MQATLAMQLCLQPGRQPGSQAEAVGAPVGIRIGVADFTVASVGPICPVVVGTCRTGHHVAHVPM